ncbi:DUF697 domain-containing protein [Thiothrix litoralis]|jgi:uncharacterized protein (DUF697 family)|uniref:DUF697 domain-containing protein n=1 Tax=Thiothrix litoralis TaxID=2891210 RepID=A0ABX7WTR4_9GAMM|nr:DUF697 domain-containing protein [Thiothrix litoralis]QTR46621.1 DUF697 domain-containing protein [Thiothrix litoralis]
MSEDSVKTSAEASTNHTVQSSKAALSRQIKEQAQRIDELTALIQQKEQELIGLSGQAHLMDELTHKLQKTETAMQLANAQVQAKSHLIDELTGTLKEKEQQIMTAAEHAQLIDDLTAKLQEVEIKLVAASLQGKHSNAQNTVKTHMVSGMALGLLPAPLFDIMALSAVQLNLLRSLCNHYSVDFDEQLGKGIVSSLISGSLPVLTVLGLSSFAKLIPGIGTVGGGLSMTALAGAAIYAAGQVFIRHFEAGGTLQDFDSKHWQAFFKQQLEEGKAFVRNKLDTAGTTKIGA